MRPHLVTTSMKCPTASSSITRTVTSTGRTWASATAAHSLVSHPLHAATDQLNESTSTAAIGIRWFLGNIHHRQAAHRRFLEKKLYWCDREGMQYTLRSRWIDVEALVVAGEGDDSRDARNHCVGIAVDTTDRMIYWSQKGPPDAGQGRILRAPIDIPPGRSASDRDDIETLWPHCQSRSTCTSRTTGTWCGRIEEPSRSAIPSTELA